MGQRVKVSTIPPRGKSSTGIVGVAASTFKNSPNCASESVPSVLMFAADNETVPAGLAVIAV